MLRGLTLGLVGAILAVARPQDPFARKGAGLPKDGLLFFCNVQGELRLRRNPRQPRIEKWRAPRTLWAETDELARELPHFSGRRPVPVTSLARPFGSPILFFAWFEMTQFTLTGSESEGVEVPLSQAFRLD